MNAIKRAVAIGGMLAVVAASAAFGERPADPGSQGQGQAGGHSKKGGKATVSYVFKGAYAGNGSVDVDRGNAHVRKAGLVGTTVSFDLSSAQLVVGDVDGSGTADLADVAAGDRVVVKARLPRNQPSSQPFAAKQLVDQTHPVAVSSDSD